MKLDKPNISVITVGSYPNGGAAPNRHLAYLRGLTELGALVNIYIVGANRDTSYSSNARKVSYYSLDIIYTCLKLGHSGKLKRYLNTLFGFIVSIKYLVINSRRPNKYLLLLITNPILLFIYIIFSKIFGYKTIHERTEFPYLTGNRIIIQFYLRFIVPQFDALLVITQELKNFFSQYTQKPIFHLPMVVELDRFETNSTSRLPYLAYCGSMYTDKDGVPDLIQAFRLVSDEFPDLSLYLIGNTSDRSKMDTIYRNVQKTVNPDRFIFTGLIGRDKIPKLLGQAQILLLARPDNEQAKGGFPTKLGEYLATGNPVVITDVGEHSQYLEDGISAMIAEPSNPTDFAAKILILLRDPVLAREIGLQGRKMAERYFNYNSKSHSFMRFIMDI